MRHAEPPEAYQDRLSASLDYLESHLGGQFSLDEMAWNACLSPFHFHRLFHKLVGRTPGDHLRLRRLEGAARALLGSDLPVGEIARSHGYISIQGFMRAFRTHFQATPAEYRALGLPLFLSVPFRLDLAPKPAQAMFSEPVATLTGERQLMGLSRSGKNDHVANSRLVWKALGQLGERAHRQPWVSMDRYVKTESDGEQYQFFVGTEMQPGEIPLPGLEILDMPQRTEAHIRFSGTFEELWKGNFQRLWCHVLPGHGMRPEASLWKRTPDLPEDGKTPLSLQIPLAA